MLHQISKTGNCCYESIMCCAYFVSFDSKIINTIGRYVCLWETGFQVLCQCRWPTHKITHTYKYITFNTGESNRQENIYVYRNSKAQPKMYLVTVCYVCIRYIIAFRSIVMAHMGIKWLFDWTFSVKYLYRYKGNKRIKNNDTQTMWIHEVNEKERVKRSKKNNIILYQQTIEKSR